MYRELLAGCGGSREKLIKHPGHETWENLTTLDIEPSHNPDVVWDLNKRPLPFEDNTFDELAFYDVLEHLGRQGDFVGFFEEFTEYWRILKPDGYLCGIVPARDSFWAWSDPGHTRIITEGTLTFLSQEHYQRFVGVTPSTDYRGIYKANFRPVEYKYVGRKEEPNEKMFCFAMQAVK